jgi:hypothetical protein
MRPFDCWTHATSPERKFGVAVLVERCGVMRTRHVAAVLMLAFMVAGCDNSGAAATGPSTPFRSTRSAASPTASSHSSVSPLAYPAITARGFSGTACNLLPPSAIGALLPVKPWTQSTFGTNLVLEDNVSLQSGTDGSGNASCQEEWNMPGQSIPVEAATDFVEHARQTASYAVSNLTPHHYRTGLPGELYSRFVSGGSPGTEVTVAYKHGFIEIDGTGLSVAQSTRLLEVAAGRASRFAPTDTLYGAGQP